MMREKGILLLILTACLLFVPVSGAASDVNVTGGAGSTVMEESLGATKTPMTLYTYRSESWQDGDPVVIVFHGMNRNAEAYRNSWIDTAEEKHLLIICPEFDRGKFPGTRYYHFADVLDREGEDHSIQPREEWTFPVVDHIIAGVRSGMHIGKSPVYLFAHSAGAQFLHRCVLLGDASEADKIVIANAGWYTMPTTDTPFPYGLGGIDVSREQLAAAFSKPVVILLGDRDVNRSKNLRQTPEADEQGMNRLERGHRFFDTARQTAQSLGVPFCWQIREIPGIGHNGAAMGLAAAELF